MTGAEIITGIKDVMDIPDTDQDAEILRILNAVYKTISAKRRWSWLRASATLTTSPSVATCTVDGDGRWDVRNNTIDRVRLVTNNTWLDRDDYEFVLERNPQLNTGTPDCWYIFGVDANNGSAPVIGFDPVPSSQLRIDYQYRMTVSSLSNSAASVPVWPVEWHPTLMWAAAKLYAVKDGDFNRMQAFALEEANGLRAMDVAETDVPGRDIKVGDAQSRSRMTKMERSSPGWWRIER